MNFSTLLGIVSALVVMALAVVMSSKDLHVFLDFHGILIVFGGTAAAGLMCFPLRFYSRIMGVVFNKFLGTYALRHEVVIKELVDLAKGVRENPDYLKQKAKSVKTAFLSDALQLMAQGGIADDVIDEILLKRAQTHSKRYEYDVGVFKTLAKFPPAFGLMGTTLGMIALLQNRGGKDAQ